MNKILIVEEWKRLESMPMKLLELIVLKKQDFKVYGISAKFFFQGIEDTVDLLMKENHIQFSTINWTWRALYWTRFDKNGVFKFTW